MKELNFFLSALNSGLNLLIILLIGRELPVEAYAEFGSGLIYGGVLVIFIAFGNDTILAREFLKDSTSAPVIVALRLAFVSFFCALVVAVSSFAVMVGAFYLAATALQNRFYFEAQQLQGAYNLIGLFEKVLIIALVMWLGADPSSDAFVIVLVLFVCRAVVSFSCSLWIFMRERFPVLLKSAQLMILDNSRNAMAFTIQFALMQLPLVYLAQVAGHQELASFTATAQLGAGLLAVVTQYQRPRIFLYLQGVINIRDEVLRSFVVVLLAIGLLALSYPLLVSVFPLVDLELLVLFGVQGVAFAILHPFELRRFSLGPIPLLLLCVSALAAAFVTGLLALMIGFIAVPIGALLSQIISFRVCKMWVVPSNASIEKP